MKPQVYAILCLDRNGGMGKEGRLPWNIPSDWNFYKSMANGCVRICGKNTYNEDFSPDNEFYGYTVVVSRSMFDSDSSSSSISSSESRGLDKMAVSATLREAVEIAKDRAKAKGRPIFLTGGRRIYEDACRQGLVDFLFLTKVEEEFDCDVHLNLESLQNYQKVESFDQTQLSNKKTLRTFLYHRMISPGSENGTKFSFNLYRKSIKL